MHNGLRGVLRRKEDRGRCSPAISPVARTLWTIMCRDMHSSIHNENRITDLEAHTLADFVISSSKLVAITGAGISTASGIPDYRSPSGSYSKGHKPMEHSTFMKTVNARKRYWMRSWAGWRTVVDAQPNEAHKAMKELEGRKKLHHIITQNVDMLHQKAGAANVTNLHGRIDQVKCMNCGEISTRRTMQDRLEEHNPLFFQFLDKAMATGATLGVRADGDVELGDQIPIDQFVLPKCPSCGGDCIKPDVVFFGDFVPKDVVQTAYEAIDNCDSLLIIGSSLEVFSAFRFVRRADEKKIPIAIINQGITRAERSNMESIVFKSDQDCNMLLKRVVSHIDAKQHKPASHHVAM